MDCSPPGSSVHEIFQARIQEWVAISFSRGSSQPRDRTWVSCTAGRFFTDWATREELFLEKAKLVPATLDFTGESKCLLHTAVLFHFSVCLALLLPIFLTTPWLPDLISALWDQHCFYLQYYPPFLLKSSSIPPHFWYFPWLTWAEFITSGVMAIWLTTVPIHL